MPTRLNTWVEDWSSIAGTIARSRAHQGEHDELFHWNSSVWQARLNTLRMMTVIFSDRDVQTFLLSSALEKKQALCQRRGERKKPRKGPLFLGFILPVLYPCF